MHIEKLPVLCYSRGYYPLVAVQCYSSIVEDTLDLGGGLIQTPCWINMNPKLKILQN